MKNIAIQHISQQNQEKPNNLAYWMKKSQHYRKAFAEIAHLDNRHMKVFPSQTHLSIKAGTSRETIYKTIIPQLERDGIIKTRRPHHYDTLEYHVYPMFHNQQVRMTLAAIPEFKEVFMAPTIWSLLPTKAMFIDKRNKLQSEYVSPINTVSILNINLLDQKSLSREQQALIQREKLLAQLTPQQKDQLEAIRAAKKSNPKADVSQMPTAQPCKKPEMTLRDMFINRGLIEE